MNEYLQVPKNLAHYACIWLHGLGASGNDMRMVAETFDAEGVIRHIFLDAPVRPVSINNGMIMPAWYDITGTKFTDREDQEGITSSFQLLSSTIEKLCSTGLSSDQILLAGFSQGAAMALYTALSFEQPLAGVIALSGYLPLSKQLTPKQPTSLPVFIGYGRFDSIVMPAWSQATATWLKEKNYHDLTVKDYPVDHSICAEEVEALSHWLKKLKES